MSVHIGNNLLLKGDNHDNPCRTFRFIFDHIMDSPSPLDQIRPPLDFQASSRQNDVNLAYNEQK